MQKRTSPWKIHGDVRFLVIPDEVTKVTKTEIVFECLSDGVVQQDQRDREARALQVLEFLQL